MTKQQEFVNWVDSLIANQSHPIEPSENVKAYLEAIRTSTIQNEKPEFTNNGRIILKYLQEQPFGSMYKAKDIAEQLGIASRSVSGAMRKLVTDGYVEKIGKEPVIYTLTELGKNKEIMNLNEE